MKKSRDFTSGSPGKQLLVFALPLIASMVLQNLYNAADSVIVGRYVGETALAAVGTTAHVSSLILMLISGATLGMSVIVSQFYGAKDIAGVKKTVATSVYIIVILSLVFSVVGAVFSRHLLKLIQVPDNVIDDATLYLRIIFLGSIATAMYNMANSLSRAMGDSVTPMIVLIITCILNVFLNILFVTKFNLAVAGVAYATVIATAISAVVCWILIWFRLPVLHPQREHLKPDREIVKTVAKLGLPSALQSSSLSLGVILLQAIVNGFGSTVMAAFSAATKIEALVSYPPGGVTQGMQVFTGQNVGAGKYDRVHQGFNAAVKMIAVYSVISAAVMIGFGGPLVSIFTSEGGEMVRMGKIYLIYSGLGVFFCGLIHLCKSTLTGAGDAAASVYVTVVELTVRVASAFVLSRYTPLGYIGAFLGTPIGWVCSGAYGFFRYKRGRWKEKRIVKEAAQN